MKSHYVVVLCHDDFGLFEAVDVMWDEHWTQVRWENHCGQLLPSVKHPQNQHCRKVLDDSLPSTESQGGRGSIKLNPAAPNLGTSHTQGTELFTCSSVDSVLGPLSGGHSSQSKNHISDFYLCFQSLKQWTCFLCSLALLPIATCLTEIRKELEEGERGKMGCSGQVRNEQPEKIKR